MQISGMEATFHGRWDSEAIAQFDEASAWIYISSFDLAQSEDELRDCFEKFGTVHAVIVLSGSGADPSFALIAMDSFEEAREAVRALKASYQGVFMIQRGEALRLVAEAHSPSGSGDTNEQVRGESSSASERPKGFRARYPRIAFTIFAVSVLATSWVFYITGNGGSGIDWARFLHTFNVGVILCCFVVVGRRSAFAAMRGLFRPVAMLLLFGLPAALIIVEISGERPFWTLLFTLLVWSVWGCRRAYAVAADNPLLAAITAGVSIVLSIISIGLLPGLHYSEELVAQWEILPTAIGLRGALLLGWFVTLVCLAFEQALSAPRPRLRLIRAPQIPPASDVLPEDFRFTFVPQFDLTNKMARYAIFALNFFWRPIALVSAYGRRTVVEAFRIVKSLIHDFPAIVSATKTMASFGATVLLIHVCFTASEYEVKYLQGDLSVGLFANVAGAAVLISTVFVLALAALRLSDDKGINYRKQMFAAAGAVYKISLTAAWTLWIATFIYQARLPSGRVFGSLLVVGTVIWWIACAVVFATANWRPTPQGAVDASLPNLQKAATT